MHKFGVALTIVLAIIGFWDVKGVFDSEVMEQAGLPILGVILFCGFMKFALSRS